MAGRADIMAGRAFVSLYVKNSDLLRGLANAKKRLEDFGTSVQQLGNAMFRMGAATLAPVGLAVKRFADFDDQMREVRAVSQGTEEQFKSLTETAKRLGATTSFTAVEVAALMTELGRAGFSPDQINVMTGAVLNLSRATKTEAATSAGIMAATLRQFRLDAGEAARVADVFTAAANKSFSSVEGLGEALSYAGPVAADFGMSIEETLAIIGGLGNVGIQGSEAGTAMRRLLTITGSEALKLRGIFGVAFVDAAGNARPLIDVLTEVNAATANLGTAARSKKFNEAFGLLGITAASAIGKASVDIKQLFADLETAGGIASHSAAAMDAGIGGAFRILLSAIEGVAIAIGEALNGEIIAISKTMTNWAGVVINIVKENKALISTVVKVAAGVAGVGGVLIAVGTAAKFLAFAFGGLVSTWTFVGAMVTKIAALAAGIAGLSITVPVLVGAVAAAGMAWLAFTESGRNALAAIRDLILGIPGVSEALTFVSDAFASVKDIVGQTWTGIKDAILSGDLSLAGRIAVAGLRLGVVQGLASLSEMVGGIWGDTIGKITSQIGSGDFVGAWATAIKAMSAMWAQWSEGIVKTFTGAAMAVMDAWKNTIAWISNAILKAAAQGGATGKILSKVLGVDVSEEVAKGAILDEKARVAHRKERQETKGVIESRISAAVEAGDLALAEKLGDQLSIIKSEIAAIDGLPKPDLLGEAGADVKRQLDLTTSEIDKALAGVNASAESRTKAATESLATETKGGAKDAVAKAQSELDRLRGEADKTRDQITNPAPAAATDKAANTGRLQSPTGDTAVTFSAAALQAIGGGGGPQERMLTELKEQKKVQRESKEELAKVNASLAGLALAFAFT